MSRHPSSTFPTVGGPLAYHTPLSRLSGVLILGVLLLAIFAGVGCGGGANATNTAVAHGTGAFSISGSISPAVGGAGATVMLSGMAEATTTASGSGSYTFSQLPPGSYTVTPSSKVATFGPARQTATISNSNLTDVNFTAATTANVFFFDNFSGTALSSDWTIISRHGEYAQNETECNVPQQVAVNNGLTISAAAQNSTCDDVNHPPQSWPYITGDIQWTTLNFTYGTVEIRGQFPSSSTGLWPAFWLLGSNCQQTNPMTADVGYLSCPDLSSPSYAEIDMVECDLDNWCQLALSNPGNFPRCGFAVDTNYHIFTLTWNANTVSVAKDGQYTGCSYTSNSMTIPSTPMFLLMQIQTGGSGGTPNNALLPAQLSVDYVRVTQP
jgi:beta-glucanase (GH16 family)